MTDLDDLILVDDDGPGAWSEAEAPPANGLAHTVLELARQGYTHEVDIDVDGLLCCRVCGLCATPDGPLVQIIHLTDATPVPGAVVAVLAVTCAACATQGVAAIRHDGGPRDKAISARLDPRPHRTSRGTVGA